MHPGTTVAFLRILSQLDLQTLSLGGLVGAYLQWFRGAENFDARRTTVRNIVEGAESSIPPESFRVKQINYVEEADSWKYRLKKFVPYLRILEGQTKITIRATGSKSRSYVWASEEDRPDFSTYLNEVSSEDYPPVKVLRPELDSESFTDIPELQLEVKSVDVTELSKVVDQISAFHEYYFDNYPGDGRSRVPY